MSGPFPFSALVGQDEMKLALLISAVDPQIGGVLVFGDRGTGKSTAVRGLAALLPDMIAVPTCPYSCAPEATAKLCELCLDQKNPVKGKKTPIPVVDMPLGATEDRVVGALDLERALVSGEKAFEPGLLARANRGFLYIDEVNLLEDHLVDLLLDVAASGENVVEREGLSIRHPARFVLIGSGNPEEGELRPQLLDRFGLSVEVTTPTDIETRIDVVKRRDAYERDPEAFIASYKAEDQKVRRKINRGRKLIEDLEPDDTIFKKASEICMALGTDGLRGELTLIRAARAFAALSNAKKIDVKHLAAITPLALRHRLRRDPLDEAGSTVRVERVMTEIF